VIRDDGTFVTPDDIEAWVNEAQMDLAARLGLSQKTVTGTTTGNTIALPPTPATQDQTLHVTSLRLGTEDDVEFTDDEVWNSWSDEGDEPEHTLARVWAGNIELYPTPDTGTAYELRYESLPPPVVDDDASSTLPHHLHPRLLFYARAMAFLKRNDQANSDRFLGMYLDGLPSPELGANKLIPGPLTITLEPGPFDVDPNARHI